MLCRFYSNLYYRNYFMGQTRQSGHHRGLITLSPVHWSSFLGVTLVDNNRVYLIDQVSYYTLDLVKVAQNLMCTFYCPQTSPQLQELTVNLQPNTHHQINQNQVYWQQMYSQGIWFPRNNPGEQITICKYTVTIHNNFKLKNIHTLGLDTKNVWQCLIQYVQYYVIQQSLVLILMLIAWSVTCLILSTTRFNQFQCRPTSQNS